jgi:hypothetical protein
MTLKTKGPPPYHRFKARRFTPAGFSLRAALGSPDRPARMCGGNLGRRTARKLAMMAYGNEARLLHGNPRNGQAAKPLGMGDSSPQQTDASEGVREWLQVTNGSRVRG